MSKYSASFTAAGMMFNETKVVVEMLLSDNSANTRKALKEDVQYLRINSVSARERVAAELSKRFNAMPESFWTNYLTLSGGIQKLTLFYALLKTYALLFDFQVNVALPKYNSIDRNLNLSDILMRLNELATDDELVDSWTEKTRKKIASTYITMLKQVNLIDQTTGELTPTLVADTDWVSFVRSGEIWFLQACFIPQYRIEQIKQISI